MDTPARLGAHVLGLAGDFAGAFSVGGAVGATGPAPEKNSHANSNAPQAVKETSHVPGGLHVSQNGSKHYHSGHRPRA